MPCIFCNSTQHDYRSCTLAYRAVQRPMPQSFSGRAPNVFIGKHGYPHVRVGILGTEAEDGHDDPARWTRENLPIPEIVARRSALVNSYVAANIKGASHALVDTTRDVSVAKRPVDVDIVLKDRPRFRISYDTHAAPHGPAVELDHARVTENLPVDHRVDRAMRADDTAAGTAVRDLAARGVDNYYLQKAFSMGNFGIATERKLVPTRWSITAVDDILSAGPIDAIKAYAPCDCMLATGGHLGNWYVLLFFDDVWSYELVESHTGSQQQWTDWESFAGRTAYASETAGGYYAARLPIADFLARTHRQGAVLALRFITPEYTTPLGVWVVREAVRNALARPPQKFSDRAALIDAAQSLIRERFSYDAAPIFAQSKLLALLTRQRKLQHYGT